MDFLMRKPIWIFKRSFILLIHKQKKSHNGTRMKIQHQINNLNINTIIFTKMMKYWKRYDSLQ